jgi:hypothetical protein
LVLHIAMEALLAAAAAEETPPPPAPQTTALSGVASLSGGARENGAADPADPLVDAASAPISTAASVPMHAPTPTEVEIPGSLGRAPTFMNALVNEQGVQLQEATGWTLGTSISRVVSGVKERVLKTKWRIANSTAGPILHHLANEVHWLRISPLWWPVFVAEKDSPGPLLPLLWLHGPQPPPLRCPLVERPHVIG